jgi:hypothetical protein
MSARLGLAELHRRIGEPERAIEVLQKAVRNPPKRCDAGEINSLRFRLADLLLDARDTAGARAQFKAIMASRPGSGDARAAGERLAAMDED